MSDASLTVATGQTITLSSLKGSVTQTLMTRSSGATQQSLPSGLLTAAKVVATAATGLTLNSLTANF